MPPKSWFDKWEKEKEKNLSDADKLFEELGYTERYEEDYGAVICFKKSNGVTLKFDLEEMGFTKLLDVGEHSLKIRMLVSFKELKAINMKCRELGWE